MNLLVHKIHEQVNLVYESSKFWWALRPINPCLLVCAPTFSYEIRKKCKLQQSCYNMKVEKPSQMEATIGRKINTTFLTILCNQ